MERMRKSSSGDCVAALVPNGGRFGDCSTQEEMDTRMHRAARSSLMSANGSVAHPTDPHQIMQSRKPEKTRSRVSVQGSDWTLHRK